MSDDPGGLRGFVSRHIGSRIVATERESVQGTSTRLAERPGLDAKALTILTVVPLNLALIHYFGLSDETDWLVDAMGLLGVEDAEGVWFRTFRSGQYARLHCLLYWVACTSIGYFVIPALIVKLAFREKLADYGMQLKGTWKHLWLYGAMFAVILPAVVYVSGDPSFLHTYPFYKQAGRSAFDFIVWELAYAFQFFALEFFFRGFMVHGLKHRLGVYSIAVMVIPYCMIHFGKPFPETVGAIIAGLVLGGLSLWTRNIWLGVLIHVTVAITMDVLALHHMGVV